MERKTHKLLNTVIGSGGISATVLAHSMGRHSGKNIATFVLEYPRFIHAELMTHRLFSRNAASSRAIPVERNIQHIKENTAMPIHWGKNQPGMSAKEECDAFVAWHEPLEGSFVQWESALGWVMTANDDGSMDEIERIIRGYVNQSSGFREDVWRAARDHAIKYALALHQAGYHKQIVNRLLEPFVFMKTIVTATEFDNFFALRRHPDAQPEIKELADVMWKALQGSAINVLEDGEYHMPYFGDGFWCPMHMNKDTTNLDKTYTLEEALAISASCCAQVSYRRLDDSLEKALEIYDRLVHSKPVHASPFEHQATPIAFIPDETGVNVWDSKWVEGITHVDRYNNPWSGNFCGWIQHRQLIPGNTVWEY